MVAFGTLSAALVSAFVWHLLKSKGFASSNRLHLAVLALFFLTLAAALSFMLFNALTHGEAYGIGSRDTGKVHPLSREPVSYWFLVVLCWGGAVAGLSFGLAAAAKLLHAGPSSEHAADLKDAKNDAPPQPFERLAQYAAIAYLAAVLIAVYVYWSQGWELPSRNRVAAVLFAPVFLFFGVLALYTGEVGLKIRSKAPFAYWARVALMLVLGVGLLLIGIGINGA